MAEIQYRMSAREFGRWCKYFAKHGRITPERRFDTIPFLTWRVDRALGGTLELKEMLPHLSSATPETEADISAVLKEFGGVKVSGK